MYAAQQFASPFQQPPLGFGHAVAGGMPPHQPGLAPDYPAPRYLDARPGPSRWDPRDPEFLLPKEAAGQPPAPKPHRPGQLPKRPQHAHQPPARRFKAPGNAATAANNNNTAAAAADDDDDDATSPKLALSSNPSRHARNLAEKNRRDTLNGFINQMCHDTPTINYGNSSRKKDKLTVFRYSGNFLRVQHTIGWKAERFLPSQFNCISLESLVDASNMEGMGAMCMFLTMKGRIIYASSTLERFFGYDQGAWQGESLFNLMILEEFENMLKELLPHNGKKALTNGSHSEADDTSNSSEEYDDGVRFNYEDIAKSKREICLRIQHHTNSRKESAQYEWIRLRGFYRFANAFHERIKNMPKDSPHPIMAGQNDLNFFAIATPLGQELSTVKNMTFITSSKDEYFTRHLIDGRIIFCDQRISMVTGYMSEEVSGSSAFKFMHREDVKWTIVALRHMYYKGENWGYSCYRLQVKTGEYIYLRTNGYLEYDRETKSVCSFICVNTLVEPQEGECLIAEMKKRFSAVVDSDVNAIEGGDRGNDNTSPKSDGMGSGAEEEDQFEDTLFHMINDLPTPVITEAPVLPNEDVVRAAHLSETLPPAKVHASEAGITDPWPCSGKGVKRPRRNTDESTSSGSAKRASVISESDDALSPITPGKHFVAKEQVSSPKASKSEINDMNTNAETIINPTSFGIPYDVSPNGTTDYLKSELQSENNSRARNTKRPREPVDTDYKSNKRKTKSKRQNLNPLPADNSVQSTNGDVTYQKYLPVEPVTFEEIPLGYRQFDATTLAATSTEDGFTTFADEQILSSTMSSNPDMIQLFTNLQDAPIDFEGILEETSLTGYPMDNQETEPENGGRQVHILENSNSSLPTLIPAIKEEFKRQLDVHSEIGG